MIQEEKTEAALVQFLKTRKIDLGATVAVVGKGDLVPEEGARLFVGLGFQPIGTGPLHYAQASLDVEVSANQAGAANLLADATEFVDDALPPDQSQAAALSQVIQDATGGAVKLNFYHHQATDLDAGDENTWVRPKRVRLALEVV